MERHPMLSFPQNIVPGVFSFTATRRPSLKVNNFVCSIEKLKSQIVVQAGLLSASVEKRSAECSNVSGRGECDIPGHGVSFRSLHSPEEGKNVAGTWTNFIFGDLPQNTAVWSCSAQDARSGLALVLASFGR